MTAAPTTDAPERTEDIAAIVGVIDAVADGIERRDPDACVARFTADARSITGARIVGRDAIRAAHVTVFAADGVPATPRFALLDVVFLRPDVAHVTTGAYAAEPIDLDAPPTLVTWTMVREDDGWWIAARQFTKVAA